MVPQQTIIWWIQAHGHFIILEFILLTLGAASYFISLQKAISIRNGFVLL
jgi:hypothetical protein